MIIQVDVIEKTLTDRSKVYNVTLLEWNGGEIEFPCVTRGDAEKFADKLRGMIGEYTLVRIA